MRQLYVREVNWWCRYFVRVFSVYEMSKFVKRMTHKL